MRLNALVTGLARRRSGIALLIGVSSMLTGIVRLLAPKPRSSTAATATRIEERKHYFSIRQTRSEVGFVYWVLQGFGCYQSFSLHDTWQEAKEEANRRIARGLPVVPLPEYVYASAIVKT